MTKKLISIVLIIVLSLPFISHRISADEFEYVEMPVGSKEELRNGSFEDFREDGITLVGWAPISKMGVPTSLYTVTTVTRETESENVRSGEQALKITGTGGNPYVKQSIMNPEIGATYQISLWYKITSPEASPGFKLEWYKYDEDGKNQMINSKVQGGFIKTTTDWVRLSYQFVIPEECVFFTYYVRLYTSTPGEAYFDDASCYKIKDAPVTVVTISTDEVFYYTDMKSGIATANANLPKFPNISTIEFKIKDEETVLGFKNVNVDSSGKAIWRFDPTIMMEEKKEYVIEAVAKNSAGEVFGTAQDNILRYKRPKMLREDGTIVFDNEPFYPVFAYHVYLNDLKYAAQMGINACQLMSGGGGIEAIKAYLEEADKYGIKCLIPLYGGMKPAAHPDNVQNTIDRINELKDEYDNILGWMVMDEATAHWPGRWDLFYDSYRLIRELDYDRPVYILQNIASQFANIGKYTDILAYDPYPPRGSNMAQYVVSHTTMATEGVSFRKPVWCLNKAYAPAVDFDPAEHNVRPLPTIMEERHLWYQALFAGASAVGFYSFSDAIITPRMAMYKTSLWPGLVEFAEEEMEESYNHFIKGEYPIYSEGKEADVRWSAYVKNGSVYMIILNQHESERNVTIPLHSDRGLISIYGFTAERIYGGNHVTAGSGTLDLNLEDSAAYVYKITPDNPLDFSSLNKTKFRDLVGFSWASEQIRELENANIIEGVTKTAYKPYENITKGDFAKYLANALKTEVNIDYPYNEISREEMMNICKNEIAKTNSFSEYIMTDIAARIKAEVLKGNINRNENVTRAEAAFILEGILKGKTSSESIFKEVLPEDIGTLFNGLTKSHTDEFYEGSLFYKKWTESGKGFVLVQNIDSVDKTVIIEAGGKVARLIFGDLGSEYDNNLLKVKIPAKSIAAFEIFNNIVYGVYKDNIMVESLISGEFVLKHPNAGEISNLPLVVLYRENNDGTFVISRLLNPVKVLGGWKITVPTLRGENYILKSFIWDSPLNIRPYCKTFILP